MEIFKYILVAFLLSLTSLCYSQLQHFSDYVHNPLALSATQIGQFSGTIRVGGSIREQFKAFIFEPFQTQSVYIDSPITAGFNKKHWVGLGVQLSQDQAGDLSRQQSNFTIGTAYHIGLNDEMDKVLSFGAQYRLTSTSFDGTPVTENSINNLTDPDINNLLAATPSYNNFNTAISYKSSWSNTTDVETGIAVNNITKSRFEVLDSLNKNNAEPLRYHAYMKMNKQLTDNFMLQPTIVYQRADQFTSNIMILLGGEVIMKENSHIKLNGQIGYRLSDALIFSLGGKYKDWSARASYDVTVSSAQAYNGGRGAFELGLFKIFKIYPKPVRPGNTEEPKKNGKNNHKYDLIELCPRL